MEYSINALAKLSGVTPRTLRWYDETGLLKPLRTSSAGYRIYGPEQVTRLQDILFYRELGLELSAIRTILDDPNFDRLAALQSHLAELDARRERLNTLIAAVQNTITEVKGGNIMSDPDKFAAFKKKSVEENEAMYGEEIREKYGNDAVEQTSARMLSMPEEDYRQWTALATEILADLETAVTNGADPAGEAGRHIAELHRRWLMFTWAAYTPQAHAGLARMYVADRRFTAYYDRSVPGCAGFLRDAILAYTQSYS